jgi:hypothetical protein
MIGIRLGVPPRIVGGDAANAWQAWNDACTDDGAFAAEAAVNLCLFGRFQGLFQIVVDIWGLWNDACTADGATAPEAAVFACLKLRFNDII